jgi:hypothetical protein
MTRYCNEPDFVSTIKQCTICGGNVHLHFEGKDEDGFWIWSHCHICGEYYCKKEWQELEEYK